MSEKAALTPKRPEPPPTSPLADQTLYHDSTQTPRARLLQICFVTLVTIMVLLSIILSIVQGVKLSEGLYFMLGLCLIGFVAVEILLCYCRHFEQCYLIFIVVPWLYLGNSQIRFIRTEELPREKLWFLYFVGGCVILECIFTDVALYN